MMLRYFIRIPDTATAESDRTANALLARGYKECNHDYYMTWRQLNDGARRAELVREDTLTIQRMSYAERVRRGV